MPVEVPTLEEVPTIAEFVELKEKVYAQELPEHVKDAVIVLCDYLKAKMLE